MLNAICPNCRQPVRLLIDVSKLPIVIKCEKCGLVQDADKWVGENSDLPPSGLLPAIEAHKNRLKGGE